MDEASTKEELRPVKKQLVYPNPFIAYIPLMHKIRNNSSCLVKTCLETKRLQF